MRLCRKDPVVAKHHRRQQAKRPTRERWIRGGKMWCTANDHLYVYDIDNDGNGFVFDAAQPQALLEALQRAFERRSNAPAWQAIMRRGMAQDLTLRGTRDAVAAFQHGAWIECGQ